MLSVSPAGGTIAENGGNVSFTIARVNGKGGAVSVQVACWPAEVLQLPSERKAFWRV